MKKICNPVIVGIILICSVQLSGQKKDVKQAYDLIVSIERLKERIGDISIERSQISKTELTKTLTDIAQRIGIEQDSISFFIEKSRDISFSRFCKPKLFNNWPNSWSHLNNLSRSIENRSILLATLPEKADQHIQDSFSIAREDRQSPMAVNFRKFTESDTFDEWIKSVYHYNIKPGFLNTQNIQLISDYLSLCFAMEELELALPSRWQKKLTI